MRQNDLPPVPGSVHKKKRVGRGNSSGHGTYSGRGIKGQASRSGPDIRIGFEGGQIPLIRALSRKRGFHNRFRVEYEVINVGQLTTLPAGTTLDPDSMRASGVVKSARMPVKILGEGEIEIALTIHADKFSASAKAKIEAAGGKAILVNGAEAEPKPVEAAAPVRRRRARAAAPEAEEAETPAAEPESKDEAES
ncbi:MAG: 50S ribosomal protein L15 [Dehalococcoidia bacterium]|nr:50S ribosomal protein L15 [Dehalococcoidia bacterium]